MTLHDFQRLTAESDERALRLALALALATEIPRTPESFARFYARVAADLQPEHPATMLASSRQVVT